MPKPKIYITRKIPSPGVELVCEFCDVTLNEHDRPPTREELVQNIHDKDGILCLLTERIDREIMSAAPLLKAISTMSVGFEHVDVTEATKRGIYIGHTPGILTDATADLAFALILSAARRIPEADRFVREGRWNMPWSPTMFLGGSVWGSTLGIIGLGRIGKAVAKRARGFRMRILYTDTNPIPPEEEKTLGVENRSLEALLQEADFITIHTPATKQTHHMINSETLQLMKPGAILINTSRGTMVDETALAEALKENRINGAALDVFETEPLSGDSPLLGLNNVVLLPHIGSATKETRARMAELAARNLIAILKGEPPPHLVNPEVEQVRPLSEVKAI